MSGPGRRAVLAVAIALAATCTSCTTGPAAAPAPAPVTHGASTSAAAGCLAGRRRAATHDDTAYVLSRQGQLTAVSLTTGHQRWTVTVPSEFTWGTSVTLSPCAPVGYILAQYANDATKALGPTSALVPVALDRGTLGRPIPVGSGGPVAIAPDGLTAYVANQGGLISGPFGSTVTPVDLRAGRALRPIRVGEIPGGVAVVPDGRTLLVSVDNQIVPISTTTRAVGTPIPLPSPAKGQTTAGSIAIDPADGLALVGNMQLDLGGPADVINVLDLKTLRAEPPIVLGGPFNSAQVMGVSSDGSIAVAQDFLGNLVIDLASRSVRTTAWGTDGNSALAFGNNGTILYTVSRPDDPSSTAEGIVPIDTSDGTRGAPVATVPGGETIYVSMAIGP